MTWQLAAKCGIQWLYNQKFSNYILHVICNPAQGSGDGQVAMAAFFRAGNPSLDPGDTNGHLTVAI
jgi:hypothetical protein